MKITCKKEILNTAVNTVISAVSKKSTIPALEGILLKAKDNSLVLSAYDLEIGIVSKIECNIIEEGEIILPAKIFSNIVRSINSPVISIETDKKYKATVSGGINEYSVSGIDANEFPSLPQVAPENSFVISCETLVDVIKKTIFAVALVDYRPVYTGSKFIIKDGQMTVVSIDNYRLAKASAPITNAIEGDFVVPGKTLNEILRQIPEKDDTFVTITVSKKHILFKLDDTIIISRLLEGEFINFESVLPQKSETFVNISTREFINAIERVALIINDKLKSPVRCNFSEGKVSLSCSTTTEQSYDECPCDITGPDIEIGFNNRYLLDALKASDCDMVKLSMTSPSIALIITPLESDDFVFLVGPMRLKGEN